MSAVGAGLKTAPFSDTVPSFFFRKRWTVVCLILVLSGGVCHGLGRRLYAELLYKRAEADLRERKPKAALFRMETAVGLAPKEPAFWTRLGEARHLLAKMEPLAEGKKRVAEARAAFEKAFCLNPLDPESAFRLAEEEALLERISRWLGRADETPGAGAREFFETAILLRPGSVRYHQAFVRYLGEIKDAPVLERMVAELSRIHPGVAVGIRKEPFWTPALEGAVLRGLEAAMASGERDADVRRIIAAFLKAGGAPSSGAKP